MVDDNTTKFIGSCNSRQSDFLRLYKQRFGPVEHKLLETVQIEDKTEFEIYIHNTYTKPQKRTNEPIPPYVKNGIREMCPIPTTANSYNKAIIPYFTKGWNLEKLRSTEALEDYLKTIPSSQHERICYALIKVLKIVSEKEIQKVLNIANIAKGAHAAIRVENRMGSQNRPPLTLREIRERGVRAMEQGLTTTFMIGYLYGFEAPWRTTSICRLTFDTESTTDNVVDIENKCIIFNNYKTVKSYGKGKKEPISDLTVEVFKEWQSIRGEGRVFHFTASHLAKMVNNIFGCGVRDLRHSFITRAEEEMSATDFARYCQRLNTSGLVGKLVYSNN